MDVRPVRRWIKRAIGGVMAGGASVGFTDGCFAAIRDTLPRSAVRAGGIAVLDSLAVAAIVTLLVGPWMVAFGARWPRSRSWDPAWTGAWLGGCFALLLVVGERWFTRPPPHTSTFPGHGSVPVYLGISVVLLVIALFVARWVNAPAHRWTLEGLLVAGVAAGMALMVRSVPTMAVAGADSPNLVLVSIDTIRADHVGVYGATQLQTPSLDRLAAEGTLFETAVAQIPVTGPSHITLMTGVGPWSHGALLNGVPMPLDRRSLAEQLRQAGYRTGAFVSAYVLDGTLGFARGFEIFDDDFGWLQGWVDTAPGRWMDAVARHRDPARLLERRAARTVNAATAWVEEMEQQPFFLWVHLFDPHGPYAPPPPWDTAYYSGDPRDPAHESMRAVTDLPAYLAPSLDGITDTQWAQAQYAGEISYADVQLGRLLDVLDKQDLGARTLVVVVGDHGESLGEHGVWFNHGGDLFESSVRVPMAFRYPGGVPAGRRVAGPVELTDVAPTIYGLLGISGPDGAEGHSLVAAMRGEATQRRPFARSLCFDRPANLAARARGEIDKPKFLVAALRGAGSRYLLHNAPGMGEAYFDLRIDPSESTESPVAVELLAALRDQAEDLMAQVEGGALDRGSARDAAVIEKLRALGYVE